MARGRKFFLSLPYFYCFASTTPAFAFTRSRSVVLGKNSFHQRLTARVAARDRNSPSFWDEDFVSEFCEGTNEFWRQLVLPPIRNAVEVRPGGTSDGDILGRLFSTPEVPGVPRPVWLTILGSVPTGLLWYGYYKFCVEEELFQWEKQKGEKFTGCGGYGTLFPFVFGIIIGGPLSLLHVPGGEFILQSAGTWILLGQVNLYRRVNALCQETKVGYAAFELILSMQSLFVVVGRPGEGAQAYREPPLHEWWAFLPPPLDVVVGLRQVHFLSEYWKAERRNDRGIFGRFSGAGMKGADPSEDLSGDIVAVELFPFISAPRFTLREFATKPSLWFWFTRDWKDFDFSFPKQ